MTRNTLHCVKQLKQDLEQNEISESEFRREILYIAIQKMRLNYTGIIGKGTFGDVISVKLPNIHKEVAVKMVTNENVGMNEIEWKRFNHRNVLPLLETQYFPQLDLQFFITPIEPFTLEEILQESLFYVDSKALEKLIHWMAGITSALDCLHKEHFCHTNIKTSNILISSDLNAKVFDFHYLNSVTLRTRTKNFRISHGYSPPEAYIYEGRNPEVEGRAFDIWCLGIMAIEMFTKNYITNKIPDGITTWIDIYPIIFRILQKRKFRRHLTGVFPECSVQNDILKTVRNFATDCLRFVPEQRPTAEKLQHHAFLDETGYLEKKDRLWACKMGAKSLKVRLSEIHHVSNEDLDPRINNLDQKSNEKLSSLVNEQSVKCTKESEKPLKENSPGHSDELVHHNDSSSSNAIAENDSISIEKAKFNLQDKNSFNKEWKELGERSVLKECFLNKLLCQEKESIPNNVPEEEHILTKEHISSLLETSIKLPKNSSINCQSILNEKSPESRNLRENTADVAVKDLEELQEETTNTEKYTQRQTPKVGFSFEQESNEKLTSLHNEPSAKCTENSEESLKRIDAGQTDEPFLQSDLSFSNAVAENEASVSIEKAKCHPQNKNFFKEESK